MCIIAVQIGRRLHFCYNDLLRKHILGVSKAKHTPVREFFREITTFISRHPSFHDFFRNCVKADSRVSVQQYIGNHICI